MSNRISDMDLLGDMPTDALFPFISASTDPDKNYIFALKPLLDIIASGSLSALLAAISAAGSSANKLMYYTGTNTVSLADLTAAARTFLAAADAAAERSAMGLGTAAVQNTGTSGANVPLLNGANTHSALTTFSAGANITQATTPGTTAVGYLGCPVTIRDAAYTTVMADAGTALYHTSGSAHTWTIDSNSNVALPVGTILTFINESGAGVVTLAITTDTLRWTASTGSRSLAANAVATAIKVTSTAWRMTGDGIT